MLLSGAISRRSGHYARTAITSTTNTIDDVLTVLTTHMSATETKWYLHPRGKRAADSRPKLR